MTNFFVILRCLLSESNNVGENIVDDKDGEVDMGGKNIDESLGLYSKLESARGAPGTTLGGQPARQGDFFPTESYQTFL